MAIRNARHRIGVLLYDYGRYRRALAAPDRSWIRICNRDERLTSAPDGAGVQCEWRWTTELHAPKVFTSLGRRLLTRALTATPIAFADRPRAADASAVPDVTFVVGHRGADRVANLLCVLRTIAAQESARVECIVVEQSDAASIGGRLPSWVRYVHAPSKSRDAAYCRSQAFNAGVRHAGARVIVLHDNDLLLPASYAASVLHRVAQGFDVVNLKRFLFYLSRRHTERLHGSAQRIWDVRPDTVLQNALGGGSIAITADAYRAIGGFDEAFVGWGGEDNEFWERAQTRRVYPFGELPLVHLWHAPQAGSPAKRTPATERYETLSAVPPEQRIRHLTQAW
jgi:hypothetical protein